MVLFKKKIESNLKYALDNKLYKMYRVNIYCKTLLESVEKKIKSSKGTVIHTLSTIKVICAVISPKTIERLLELPEIDYICMDSHAFLCASSVLASNNISSKTKYPSTGKGIGIAIIDSGVYPHPDLQKPTNRIKNFIDLLSDFHNPYDDNGHGTFICGMVAGSGYSSKGMYKGVAEDAHIYCIKAFNSIGRAYISDIFYGIECVLRDSEEYNIKVICLPFELMEHNPFILDCFSKLFDSLIIKGIIPVVPAGSQTNNQCTIKGIATLNNCITVGGLDTTSKLSPYKYSSAGPYGKIQKPDLSAACVDICSLNSNIKYVSERNGMKLFPHSLEKPYTSYTGTSCAAAFISGICALILENKQDLKFKDIIALLKISCKQTDISSWIEGHGVIDIEKLFL